MQPPDIDVTRLESRTVAQLKQVCKDLGIKGYSKLGKSALVEKIKTHVVSGGAVTEVGAAQPLGDAGRASGVLETASGPGVGGSAHSSTTVLAAPSNWDDAAFALPSNDPVPHPAPIVQLKPEKLLALPNDPPLSPEVQLEPAPATSAHKPDTTKRPFDEAFPPVSTHVAPSPKVITKRTKVEPARPASNAVPSSSCSESVLAATAFVMPTASTSATPRFKVPPPPTITKLHLTTKTPAASSSVPAASPPLQSKTTFPAVFTSARFAPLMPTSRPTFSPPPVVVNLSPKLLNESTDLPTLYAASFLPRLCTHLGLSHRTAISIPSTLHARSTAVTTIVMRFLLAKGWYAVNSPDYTRAAAWMDVTIIDAREVLHDEVWSITQRLAGGVEETVLVLYETCEVIGRGDAVRADWEALVGRKGLERRTVWDCIAWCNGEEYERGIGKLFLSRVDAVSEELGAARRYVLAHVAANRCVSLF